MMAATNRTTTRSRLLATALVTVVALGILGGSTNPAVGQTGETDFRAYPLRYAQAGDVQQSLKTLVGPDVELIPDSKLNRILVRGSAQSQQLVKSTLQTLDQPKMPGAAANPPATPTPVLKVYSIGNGNVLAVADWLRGQFSREADVRVAADQASGNSWSTRRRNCSRRSPTV